MILAKERFNVVLSCCLFVGLELIGHELTRILHTHQSQRERRPVKVDNLPDVSLRRYTIADAIVLVIQELLVRGHKHHVISMEVIVGEAKVPLSER